MYFNDYQAFTRTTIAYDKDKEKTYLERGLVAEIGEVLGVLAKFDRGDYSKPQMVEKLTYELGDVLWFVTRLADAYHIHLSDVAHFNKRKLQQRIKNKTIKGDGDER